MDDPCRALFWKVRDEFGMHDVTRGEDAKASGYIEATTTAGDIAYFRWRLRASFVSGPGGKVKPINSGYWELSGGTGPATTPGIMAVGAEAGCGLGAVASLSEIVRCG